MDELYCRIKCGSFRIVEPIPPPLETKGGHGLHKLLRDVVTMAVIAESQSPSQAASIMEMLKVNPELAGQILKNLLLNAEYPQPSSSFAD